MARKRLCIIGFGRMGKQAVNAFADQFQIEVISRRDISSELVDVRARQSSNNTESLSEADVIFLAIPIWAFGKWISKINEHAKSDCVVIDCCTARLAADRELSILNRERFGLSHLSPGNIPLFGKADPEISACLKRMGCKLIPRTAEDEDRRTGPGMAHFIGMALELYLPEEEREKLPSGAGRFLLQLIEHLKTNSPSTYRETQLLNPFMADARKKVIKALVQFDEALNRGEFNFQAYPRDKWRD